MKWKQFLNDHQLNTDRKFQKSPDGEYLFLKVAHDVLECLTGYEGCMEIATKLNNNEFFFDAFDCLNKWDPVLKEWTRQVTSLVEKHNGKYDPKSIEWARLISEIGNIVAEVQAFRTELVGVELPNNDRTSQILKLAIVQSKKLELIWMDIQNQEYKHLWTVTRYSDLIATN